jgi:hypothetical protein
VVVFELSKLKAAPPLVNEPLTIPVNPAALSFRLCTPLPVLGDMPSTIRKVALLEDRCPVDWLVELPTPNRLRIDFTVPAIGEINHALPMPKLLPLLLEACFVVFV